MAAGRAIPPAAALEVMYAAVTDEMLEARVSLLLAQDLVGEHADRAMLEVETINAELARRDGS